MAQQLKTDIILNLAGNLAAKAKQYGASMSDFARKNERAMTLLKTSADAAGRGIDSLGNRYVGLATAFATGTTVRNIGKFEAQMTRIGTDAKLTSEQVDALSKSILNIANQKDIRIDYTNLASAVDTVLGKSGDLEFVNENLANMGLFMQAFGVDAQTTGAIFAQFREKGVRDAEEVMKTIDDLYGQFAIGSVSVKELAEVSAQLFSTYQGEGRDAIKQMGALLQLFTKTKGNANEALTSIQGVFAAFNDKKNIEFLDRQGIEVFKKGTTEVRKPVELFLEVLDAAKNSPTKLSDVFDSNSIEGLASLYDVKNKDLIKQMTAEVGKSGDTQIAAAKNAATLNSAMTSLNNSFNKFANQRLAEPIQELADAINSVDDETIQNWLKWGETALWVVGGLVAAKKGLDMAATIKDVFGKKPGAGGAAGGGFADLGVMPVYVVNMPGGGMGGDVLDGLGGDGKPTGKPSPKLSKLPRIFSMKNLAMLGPIGYGLSISPEFSPVHARRASEVDRTGLPESFVPAPGLLDVWDELKGLFSGSSNGSMAGNSYMAGQTGGEMKLKVEVSDDRVKVTPTYLPKGFTIDPDMGAN
ncbi:phage tail tape measure protein [Vibrio cholerae]|uniref:phage tail tape measure protein n=1 Tax=Vibrio cholerae TaxID=666 RepID=UPI001A9D9D7B|nr:phage tail tape measure protein [Vibrio cholerae]MBO1366085.1 phage tail tape measure protein [Vibrio cholerae]MBO1370843.1 phage tail tape measure protein [Vibrio cholerae]MBO1374839.1 phage tail tape measure protein [Vibrio cholerae]MBO1378276.1 phage tail tape measure protein [Vibrio cholerae]MBO1406967.1 phage tail tape measure protein [Vibrio cholerae]